jgi:DNA-binding Lrp family transcriptional regulator
MEYRKGVLLAGNPISREELVKAVEGERDSLSKIVKAMHIFGPRNYTAIARITGIPVETVRYKINTQLRNRGVRVYAHIDYGKLGLARYTLRLKFNPEIEEYASKILDKLAEVGYLYYYGRTIPRWEYVCELALPPELELKYKVFLGKMVEEGIVERYSLERITSVRYVSMDAEFYDLERGVWNVKLNSDYDIRRDGLEVSIEEDVCSNPRIDSIDLKIVAWSQADAYLTPTDIAKRISCDPKKVLYHYKEHIIKQGIIKRYIVLLGCGLKAEQDPNMMVIVRFENISRDMVDEARRIMEKIPFMIRDTVSVHPVTYTSHLLIPTEHVTPILEYVSEKAASLRERIEYDIINPKKSRSYSIPYEMYDDYTGWRFDLNKTLHAVSEVAYSKLVQPMRVSGYPASSKQSDEFKL